MLTEAGIPHEWIDRTTPARRMYSYDWGGRRVQPKWGYQVIVYEANGDRLVSAIEGYGTYGFGNITHGMDGSDERDGDLIEIMGLLTPEEEEDSSVVGYLTAEEVFRRIKEAWDVRNR